MRLMRGLQADSQKQAEQVEVRIHMRGLHFRLQLVGHCDIMFATSLFAYAPSSGNASY